MSTWSDDEVEEVTSCPACTCERRLTLYQGLPDSVFKTTEGAWDIGECQACRTIYLLRRPKVDVMIRAYEAYYTHPSSSEGGHASAQEATALGSLEVAYLQDRWGYPAPQATRPQKAPISPSRKNKLDRLIRHLPARPGGRLLDYGCGSGVWASLMRQLGWDSCGIEPDPKAASHAGRAGVPMIGSSHEDLRSSCSEFDAITLNHVLEHVHHPASVLRALWRALRPGGQLWVAVPNPQSRGHRLFGAHWFPLDVPRHLFLASEEGLLCLFKAAGVVGRTSRFASQHATWVFRMSESLRAGVDPFDRRSLGWWARRRVRWMGRRSNRAGLRDPDEAEELIMRIDKPI